MTDPWNWTLENLQNLIGKNETLRMEFKSSKIFISSHQKLVDDLTVEVSAFANTEGGVIVIGIDEKKLGKTRIADRIDEGLNISDWSPEKIQQVIEGNISPFLSGLRVKRIPLDDSNTYNAYSIYVPAGTTAYQASDRRYYGRSEFESKPLPDHEIRLRMFRGKTPNAKVIVVKNTEQERKETYEEFKKKIGVRRAEKLTQLVIESSSDQEIISKAYNFSVNVLNTGEININQFKIKLDFPENNIYDFSQFSRSVKDGWMESGRGWQTPDSKTHPMQVNIFPQDLHFVTSLLFDLPTNINLQDYATYMDWTLFLNDTIPIQGKIVFDNEFFEKA